MNDFTFGVSLYVAPCDWQYPERRLHVRIHQLVPVRNPHRRANTVSTAEKNRTMFSQLAFIAELGLSLVCLRETCCGDTCDRHCSPLWEAAGSRPKPKPKGTWTSPHPDPALISIQLRETGPVKPGPV